jgi:phosphoglycolate phosphatase
MTTARADWDKTKPHICRRDLEASQAIAMFALAAPAWSRYGTGMTKTSFDLVGFDLDGTLVDSSADLGVAINHALGIMGLPPHDLADIKRFIGKGTRIFVERALRADNAYSEEMVAKVLPLFQDYYLAHVCDHTAPYPGALDAMAELRTRGVRLALCTNKSERFTHPLLRALDLEKWFDAVICGDTLGPGTLKPSPAPIHAMVERAGGGEAVFLGDTSNDIDAAKAAGTATIAVRFGFVDEADLLGADATLAHFDDLLPLLDAWPAYLSANIR